MVGITPSALVLNEHGLQILAEFSPLVRCNPGSRGQSLVIYEVDEHHGPLDDRNYDVGQWPLSTFHQTIAAGIRNVRQILVEAIAVYLRQVDRARRESVVPSQDVVVLPPDRPLHVCRPS